MTYGQWKALHPHTKVEVEALDEGAKLCEMCGKVIPQKSTIHGRPRRRYCSSYCAYEATTIRNRESKIRVKERKMADGKI